RTQRRKRPSHAVVGHVRSGPVAVRQKVSLPQIHDVVGATRCQRYWIASVQPRFVTRPESETGKHPHVTESGPASGTSPTTGTKTGPPDAQHPDTGSRTTTR